MNAFTVLLLGNNNTRNYKNHKATMRIAIRPFGNSRGIVIPKPLVIRKPAQAARVGWSEAAKALANANDDVLVMGDFGNEADKDFSTKNSNAHIAKAQRAA